MDKFVKFRMPKPNDPPEKQLYFKNGRVVTFKQLKDQLAYDSQIEFDDDDDPEIILKHFLQKYLDNEQIEELENILKSLNESQNQEDNASDKRTRFARRLGRDEPPDFPGRPTAPGTTLLPRRETFGDRPARPRMSHDQAMRSAASFAARFPDAARIRRLG